MMMAMRTSWLIFSIVLLMSAVPAGADPKAGRQLAKAKCAMCHGLDGMAVIDEAPNLAGQNRDYLVRQISAYRDGQRTNAKMDPTARFLSDDDIANVADWYALIAVSVTLPE